jgi:hypothetical protein
MLMEMGCEDGRWMELAEDSVQWWALVLAVVSCQVLLLNSSGEMLSSLLSTTDAVHSRQLWALAVYVPIFWSHLVLVGTWWFIAFMLMGSSTCNSLTHTSCSPGEWQSGTYGWAQIIVSFLWLCMYNSIHKSDFMYFCPMSLRLFHLTLFHTVLPLLLLWLQGGPLCGVTA